MRRAGSTKGTERPANVIAFGAEPSHAGDRGSIWSIVLSHSHLVIERKIVMSQSCQYSSCLVHDEVFDLYHRFLGFGHVVIPRLEG